MMLLQGAIVVIAMYIAYRIGLHYGERCGEIRGYARGRAEARAGGIVESHLAGLLQAMVARNHTLTELLRFHAPDLFVPPVETPGTKPH